ncbi:MAG: DNA mismatch endonuclease Vsr [Bacteroidales bacterium]|nr:DNA mismatch endonuclease Vsr [Bacteroidales bacterium]
MTDIHDKKTRSFNMSRIKGKNTKPEILVRQFLYKNGFRYRLNYKKLPGKPDIVLPKYKTAIFVNGCFWHGHENCKDFVIPKTRTDWWIEKINQTKNRDLSTSTELASLGWKVKIIWECELKSDKREQVLEDLIVFLSKK